MVIKSSSYPQSTPIYPIYLLPLSLSLTSMSLSLFQPHLFPITNLPFPPPSPVLLCRMIIDCVNRRLELVDRRELIFNEVKKYGYSPEGETGSLLLYSMLRWYYKVNENDFIKLNESQYFIVNILMDLINNLYISPFSISLIFHYTYQSAMTPSQSNPAGGKDHTAMDTEEESAEKAGKGGKIELKTKTNKDIYIYLFFKYLTKLI